MKELLPNEAILIRCVENTTRYCGDCYFHNEKCLPSCKHCRAEFRKDGKDVKYEEIKDFDSRIHRQFQIEHSAAMEAWMCKVITILRDTGYFKWLSEEEGLSEEVFVEQFKQSVTEGNPLWKPIYK